MIDSNEGETFSWMLPFSGLLKFFLPTANLSFIMFLILSHFFLVLFFCFHCSFHFFALFCVFVRVCACACCMLVRFVRRALSDLLASEVFGT